MELIPRKKRNSKIWKHVECDLETTKLINNDNGKNYPFLWTFSIDVKRTQNKKEIERNETLKRIPKNGIIRKNGNIIAYAHENGQEFFKALFGLKYNALFFHNLKHDGPYIINELKKMGLKYIQNYKFLTSNFEIGELEENEDNYYVYKNAISQLYMNTKKENRAKKATEYNKKIGENVPILPNWILKLLKEITGDYSYIYVPNSFNLSKLYIENTFKISMANNREFHNIIININNTKFEIKDTAKILNYMPIAIMGEQIGVKKKYENIDYNEKRIIKKVKEIDKKIVNYALDDVEIMTKYINKLVDISKVDKTVLSPKEWKVSASSNAHIIAVRLIFETNLKKWITTKFIQEYENIKGYKKYRVKNLETGKYGQWKTNNQAAAETWKNLLCTDNLNMKFWTKLKKHYKGGVSFVNSKHQFYPNLVCGYDKVSMYPSIMSSNYLIGFGPQLKKDTAIDFSEKTFQFMRVIFTKDCDYNAWPFVAVEDKSYSKIQWRNTFKTGDIAYLNTNEILHIKKHFKHLINCFKVEKIDSQQSATTFENISGKAMKMLFKNKLIASQKIKKGEDIQLNTVRKINAKLTMNSFYGKQGQNILHDSRNLDGETIYDNVVDVDLLVSNYDIKYAICVTTAARIELSKPTINNYDSIYYSDTDSLYFLKQDHDKIAKNMKIGSNLGDWELDDYADLGGCVMVAVRSKKYLLIKKNTNKIKITFAGLDKAATHIKEELYNEPWRVLTDIYTAVPKPKYDQEENIIKWQELMRHNSPCFTFPNEHYQENFLQHPLLKKRRRLIEKNFNFLNYKGEKWGKNDNWTHESALFYIICFHEKLILEILEKWKKLLPSKNYDIINKIRGKTWKI